MATRKAGGGFIIRYSAGVGNDEDTVKWKLCGPHEIHDALAAGMDFIANSEWYESRITEGAPAGHADGAADLAFWRSRGLAKGASIFVSWDQAPARAKWGAAIAYLKAYNAALGGYFHADAYAGTPFLRYALGLKVIKYGWRPNAGSWSNDGLPYQPRITAGLLAQARKATPAAIWQTGNYWWSKQADENVLLRPVGSHMAAVVAAMPKPKPPAPAKKPVIVPPPRVAGPHYPPGHPSALVSGDRGTGLFLLDDMRVEIRHNGNHVRYL
jgi:hypothetical protein